MGCETTRCGAVGVCVRGVGVGMLARVAVSITLMAPSTMAGVLRGLFNTFCAALIVVEACAGWADAGYKAWA